MSTMLLSFFLILFIVNLQVHGLVLWNFLEDAINATDTLLRRIEDRWQIDKYPYFLRSAIMPITSWQVLKNRFELKVIKQMEYLNNRDMNYSQKGRRERFVVSFMGSSVTAGHDHHINYSVPMVLQSLMKPVFDALEIEFITRNTAKGNNPCFPYSLCPYTFSGGDADIIQWEQTFNCIGSYPDHVFFFEQFIRQSLSIPSRPILVFSESDTPSWKESECKGVDSQSHALEHDEKRLISLYKTNPLKIVSEMNRNELKKWQYASMMFKEYKTMGIQIWKHDQYTSYKCKGPYDAKWADNYFVQPWHPSRKGHELRAAHYAYFWTLILKDALDSLLGSISNGEAVFSRMDEDLKKHFLSEHHHIPSAAMKPTNFTDGMRCYSTEEPVVEPSLRLQTLILEQDLPKEKSKPEWEVLLSDSLYPDGGRSMETMKKNDELDKKYALYGSRNHNPLSLYASIKKTGTIVLCQVQGKGLNEYPPKTTYLWTANTQLYLTVLSASQAMRVEQAIKEVTKDKRAKRPKFTFDQDNALLLEYFILFPTDLLKMCVQTRYLPDTTCSNIINFIVPISSEVVQQGWYALTIVPHSDSNVSVSYLLLP